ncbi:MAG: 30S ribosomal protein S12 methylthiotransferase RimO [Clostridia bacterium]|nr:30S ribosomal protein S12 methylthiotransferase RimO [Clostridia bacterium]
MKVGLIGLGCDKNRVDGENMLFRLRAAGYELTDDIDSAEIVIINTCAFIDAAKKESIDAILDAAGHKGKSLQHLIVTGCFAERYAAQVADSLPEVDAFVSIKDEENIVGIVDRLCHTSRPTPCFDAGRVLTTPAHYAYLKISDGCNNKCTYCAIPAIRGKYVSRPIEDLVQEANSLRAQGVKELILVAQDTTAYGFDLYGRYALVDLLTELVKIDFWKIRLLYAYPELIDERLLTFLRDNERMAKYLDVPLQHVDPTVLRRMNRRMKSGVAEFVDGVREFIPDLAMRSSFICGFPYEDEDAHKRLSDFLRTGVDYGGFFAFSPEEGTPAYGWKERAKSSAVKRWIKECEISQSQRTVDRQRRFLDRTVEVLYEGVDYDKQLFYGRTEFMAPEIDTLVYFSSDFPLEIGTVYDVKIDKTDFHLYGHTVKEAL